MILYKIEIKSLAGRIGFFLFFVSIKKKIIEKEKRIFIIE
jgi:hypothetical protein